MSQIAAPSPEAGAEVAVHKDLEWSNKKSNKDPLGKGPGAFAPTTMCFALASRGPGPTVKESFARAVVSSAEVKDA